MNLRLIRHLTVAGLLAAPLAAADYSAGTLTNGDVRLQLDPAGGRLLSLTGPGGQALTGDGSLWRLVFRDGREVSAGDWPGQPVWDGQALTVSYRGPEGSLTLVITPLEGGFDLTPTVRLERGEVLDLWLPDGVRFPLDSIDLVSFPSDLGLGLKRAWFAPGSDGSAGHDRIMLGPDGLRQVAGLSADSSAASGREPVALAVTPAGADWLRPETQRLLASRPMSVDRPSPDPDLSLVAAENGDAWAGGWRRGEGWLFRIAARVQERNTQVALRVVADATVKAAPADKPVGLLRLRYGPVRGDFTELMVSAWETLAGQHPELRRRGLVVLDSPAALAAALRDRSVGAVVNPYGESLPAESEAQGRQLLTDISEYIRAGGVWWETGGYSFYRLLVPLQYRAVSGVNPALWSDFWHLAGTTNQLAIYGVQPERPGHIFQPSRLDCRAVPGGGRFARGWVTHVAAGGAWTGPPLRVLFGLDHRSAARRCMADNGQTRGLAEKVHDPETLARLRRAVLLKYDGNATEQLASLADLPGPTIIHHSNYLKGGFDKEYPDHLPVNPRFGTDEQFAEIYRRGKELGHLVMPYTNPTWWCDEPKGPTFERVGTAPLAIGLSGQPYRESYGSPGHVGWTTTLFHPAVVAANLVTLEQFTKEFPVDILFQDQTGARGFQYDFNPASPTPYAYIEGLLAMARHDAAVVPLATENGHDELINTQAMFSGLTWTTVPTVGGPTWRTLWRDRYPAETYEVSPTALYMAHHLATFTHHDLGAFVTNPETLAWSLLLGYQLSYRSQPAAIRHETNRHWLEWLCRLQQTVGAASMGQPLDHWQYLSPTLVTATYGPVKVTANLAPEPVALDEQTTLAGYGFLAVSTAPELTAGYLTRYAGADLPTAVGLVREGDGVWTYAPAGVDLRLAGEVVTTGGPAAAGVAVPAALAAQPRRTWGPSPRRVAVINIAGMGGGWTNATPADFLAALAASAPVQQGAVAIVELTSAAAVREALADPLATLAVINPYGEHFPVESPDAIRPMLTAISNYVRHGGVWFETGAYSFYSGITMTPAGPERTPVGATGAATVGFGVIQGETDGPAQALTLTAAGQRILGRLAGQVASTSTVANRGTDPREAGLALIAAADDTLWLGAVQLDGYGWLFRFGGGHPDPALMTAATAELVGWLLDQPAERRLPATTHRFLTRLR